MTEFSNDTLAYQAIQRTLRNALVQFLRERLSGSLDDPEPEIEGLFTAEQWEAARQAAEDARQSGAVTREPLDIYDELDVSHMFNIFEKFFDLLFPEVAGLGSAAGRRRQQCFTWLRDVIDVRNPISHPAEIDVSTTELLRVLESCKQLAQACGQGAAASELEGLFQQALSRAVLDASGQSPAVQVLLPPRDSVVVDFVGRRKHLEELWTWLIDPQSPRTLLSGDGGKGKSSIAYQFATSVAARPPQSLEGILWLGAKVRRFEEGTTVEIADPDFHNLDSALDQILRFYGDGGQAYLPTELKADRVVELLGDYPILLVVDDLDSILSEEDEIVDFLAADAARTGSKLLITSRRPLPGFGRARMRVEGFSLEETTDFIFSRARLLDLPVHTWSDARTEDIHRICEGSPLYIEDLLRLAKNDSIRRAVDLWSDHQGDEARRYALKRELEMLTSVGRDVLRTVALAPSALSCLEISHILNVSEERAKEGMRELEDLYLVPRPGLVEDVPRFELHRNLSVLVNREMGDPEAALHDPELARRLKTAIAGVLGQDPLLGVKREVRAYLSQAHAAFKRGEQDLAERTLDEALRDFPSQPSIYEKRAWMAKVESPRRAVDARRCWQRAYELGAREKGMYREWILMEIQEGEYGKAAEVAQKWLQRIDENDVVALQIGGYARSRRGKQLLEMGQDGHARSELRQAEGMLRRAIRMEGVRAEELDRSRAYRAWVLNGQMLATMEDVKPPVEGRLKEWSERLPDDPYLEKTKSQFQRTS